MLRSSVLFPVETLSAHVRSHVPVTVIARTGRSAVPMGVATPAWRLLMFPTTHLHCPAQKLFSPSVTSILPVQVMMSVRKKASVAQLGVVLCV